ncbi:MAG: sulfite oxidase-like oxidoreductase [Planctomycetaceae bacterium]|nr:sulfite oxidase-like oxidoreductase [Planctomycetaceae bacterium]
MFLKSPTPRATLGAMEPINERMIAAKQSIAEKGKAKGKGIGDADGRDRLPPGQKLVTDDWPVLDLGIQPNVPADSWQMKIWGACESPVVLNFKQFEKIGLVDLVTDFHCVTTWSTYDNPWRGVPMAKVIELARPHVGATHVMFHSYDGYTTNVPLPDCAREDCLLVAHWRGRPLERKHGGPVRGMIPHLYAWKSAKWLKGIEFMTGDKPGFWEVRGYHMRGDPWKEERFG